MVMNSGIRSGPGQGLPLMQRFIDDGEIGAAHGIGFRRAVGQHLARVDAAIGRPSSQIPQALHHPRAHSAGVSDDVVIFGRSARGGDVNHAECRRAPEGMGLRPGRCSSGAQHREDKGEEQRRTHRPALCDNRSLILIARALPAVPASPHLIDGRSPSYNLASRRGDQALTERDRRKPEAAELMYEPLAPIPDRPV